MPPVEVISTIAALVSAVGTGFAALAAYRSALSARRTEEASSESERRATLRQIALASVDVVTEAKRIKSRGETTKFAYNDLAVFTGNVGSARIELGKSRIDQKVSDAQSEAEHAQLFVNPAAKLNEAPAQELDRVQTRLLTSLRQLTAIREEIDEECAHIQGQCSQHREQAIKSINS